MKTVLIPIDYSPDSKNALLFALELAQKAKFRVIVFHAFYPAASPPAIYEVPSFIESLEKEKSLELEQYVQDCKASLPQDFVFDFRCAARGAAENQVPGYTEQVFHTIVAAQASRERYATPVACVAKLGTVYEQIMLMEESSEADLVVMGMQGGGTLGKALVGSTTVSVMRNSRVPVLGVPLKATFRGLRSAVFASDLSRQPDLLLLRLLRNFMKTFRPRLEMLHLHRQPDVQAEYKNVERTLQVLDEQLHDLDYKVVLRQRTEVVAGIQEFLQERQPSLLILSPQKHTFLERLLRKSVTAQMAANSAVPLLTLPSSNTRWHDHAEQELEDTDNQKR
ncbi:universal stress protein [Pontibacter beigongshangensis]|uniref:universal stress protein n=1 Tax=Pontibacter beigongshangensis TaxID=2574733 RepID=UPI00164F297A|nr:universal stress protein [Pontibacter beigongshangensis]